MPSRSDRRNRAKPDSAGDASPRTDDWARRHAHTKPRPDSGVVTADPDAAGSRHGRVPR